MTNKSAPATKSTNRQRGAIPSKRPKSPAKKNNGNKPAVADMLAPETADAAPAAAPPSSQTGAVLAAQSRSAGTIPYNQILNALPHPVIVLAADNGFIYVNTAAEAFLSTSLAMLKRIRLNDIVAFVCPLL